jgi:hypothetical protein
MLILLILGSRPFKSNIVPSIIKAFILKLPSAIILFYKSFLSRLSFSFSLLLVYYLAFILATCFLSQCLYLG